MSTTLRILRSDDLLALDIELVDLTISATSVTAMLVPSPGGMGRLIVRFPPQHVQELAFPRGAPGSTGRGYLSGPTRLVFRVDTPAPLPLTLETLLGWDRGRMPASSICRLSVLSIVAPIAPTTIARAVSVSKARS